MLTLEHTSRSGVSVASKVGDAVDDTVKLGSGVAVVDTKCVGVISMAGVRVASVGTVSEVPGEIAVGV